MTAMVTIAANELRLGFRNHWITASAALMVVLSLAISALGSAPVGGIGADALSVTIVSLASLAILLVPLMALLLSSDSVIGDIESGNMLLILACPISRSSVLAGKFAGQTLIIAMALIAGYGSAALVTFWSAEVLPDAATWIRFLELTGTSILLGAAFVAIGLLLSNLAGQRGTAAGLAVGAWLFFVLLFDMALMAILVLLGADWLPEGALTLLLMLNPADIFRLLNLGPMGGSGFVAGPAGLGAPAQQIMLWAGLLLWFAVPLGAANLVFRRKEV